MDALLTTPPPRPKKSIFAMNARESREMKEIRNAWIIKTFREAPNDQKTEVIETIAGKLQMTSQRVRDILADAKVLSRKKHDEIRKIREAVLKELGQLAVHERTAAINRIAAEHGYNSMTIKQWCQKAGVRISHKADSIQKAVKAIGAYMQTRSVWKAAKQADISQEYVSKVVQIAEKAGILRLARGAQRHDPKIKAQLEIIDKANQAINERIVELGEKAVQAKGKK